MNAGNGIELSSKIEQHGIEMKKNQMEKKEEKKCNAESDMKSRKVKNHLANRSCFRIGYSIH